MSSAITGYIDVAQISLYLFWGFFAGLIWYLHRENKREGYPLVRQGERDTPRISIEGYPAVPKPKYFIKPDGGIAASPQSIPADGPVVGAVTEGGFPGAPLVPTGNPLVDGIGPASWVMRTDTPAKTFDGHNIILPLRLADGYLVARQSHDPHGWPVVGLDDRIAGHVVDIWIDQEENVIRYLELKLDLAIAPSGHHVLLPEPYVRYDNRRAQVKVRAILAAQFADVPVLRNPDEVTSREEDRLVGYYGGGLLYAVPSRLGPVF